VPGRVGCASVVGIEGCESGAPKGTVFAVNTDGTGFTTLHSFTDTSGGANTNSDGGVPGCTLVLSGNTLYGTAAGGGSSERGRFVRLSCFQPVCLRTRRR
jgi:hypothetical protein